MIKTQANEPVAAWRCSGPAHPAVVSSPFGTAARYPKGLFKPIAQLPSPPSGPCPPKTRAGPPAPPSILTSAALDAARDTSGCSFSAAGRAEASLSPRAGAGRGGASRSRGRGGAAHRAALMAQREPGPRAEKKGPVGRKWGVSVLRLSVDVPPAASMGVGVGSGAGALTDTHKAPVPPELGPCNPPCRRGASGHQSPGLSLGPASAGAETRGKWTLAALGENPCSM